MDSSFSAGILTKKFEPSLCEIFVRGQQSARIVSNKNPLNSEPRWCMTDSHDLMNKHCGGAAYRVAQDEEFVPSLTVSARNKELSAAVGVNASSRIRDWQKIQATKVSGGQCNLTEALRHILARLCTGRTNALPQRESALLFFEWTLCRTSARIEYPGLWPGARRDIDVLRRVLSGVGRCILLAAFKPLPEQKPNFLPRIVEVRIEQREVLIRPVFLRPSYEGCKTLRHLDCIAVVGFLISHIFLHCCHYRKDSGSGASFWRRNCSIG